MSREIEENLPSTSYKLKRKHEIQDPKISRKIPKLENWQIITEKQLYENSETKEVMIEKIEKIKKEILLYETFALGKKGDGDSNINSKINKIFNIVTENDENIGQCKEKWQIFCPFYANLMTCERFFDMENLMTSFGITGQNIMTQILSYLDFDSLQVARKVSKVRITQESFINPLFFSRLQEIFKDWVKS